MRDAVHDCDVVAALVGPLVHDVELLAYQALVTVWCPGTDDFRSSDAECCAVGLPLLR